jgi:hypothetical protein
MSESKPLAVPVVESHADRIRQNDESLTEVYIKDWTSDSVDILDALNHNILVKTVTFHTVLTVQLNQEALVKQLSEVMKCNKQQVS